MPAEGFEGIKAVLFDIDDTLFPSTRFRHMALSEALDNLIRAGIKKSKEELWDALLKIIEEKGSNYQRHFDDLMDALGINERREMYVAYAVKGYHDMKHTLKPFPGVEWTLLKLKENGLRLYVASKGIKVKQWDKLIRMNIHWFFEDVFVTPEKSPQFYAEVLESIGLPAEQAVMIGDNPYADILPAREVGMKTIRAKIEGKYINALPEEKGDAEVHEFPEILDILL